MVQATWLLQASDLQQLLSKKGRLISPSGRLIPAGVLVPPLSCSVVPGSPEALEQTFAPLSRITTTGVAEAVSDGPSIHRASGVLWNSITSSSDGFVDRYFNRPVGRRLFSKWFVWTPITPNQISLLSIGVGLGGAWMFTFGDRASTIWGALLFQLSAVIECADGDVARILFKESKLGKWLDLGGDQVVHIGIFGAIAWGLHQAGSSAPVLALGAACVTGAVLSFAVILYGILRPPPGSANSRLQKFIDGANSRDFSVLVLLLACLGRLDWFLWLTAIGSQVFWITALLLQRKQVSVA